MDQVHALDSKIAGLQILNVRHYTNSLELWMRRFANEVATANFAFDDLMSVPSKDMSM